MRGHVLLIVTVLLFAGQASAGAPDAKQLGVPLYPGARYDDGLSKLYMKLTKSQEAAGIRTQILAAFTTAESVEKVAEFYRKNVKAPAGTDQSPSGWFPVEEYPQEILTSQVPVLFEGATRQKAEAVLKASKAKNPKCASQVGVWGGVEGSVSICRPYLSAAGDLADQTLILISVHKRI